MSRGERGVTAALFATAIVPRVAVTLAWARAPQWDGAFYDAGARRIAAGLGWTAAGARGASVPWSHYPVGYGAFLGLFYRIFGESSRVAPLTGCLVGALLAVVTHRLALACLTRRRALVAGLLVALWPGLVLHAPLVMTEPLAALGIVTAAWMGVSRRRGWLAAIAIGLTTLVRPPALLVAPAIAWLTRRRRDAVIAVGVALLVVAPWTARNCLALDGCALVSTNGGWNLAIGAFPRATGRYEPLKPTDGCDASEGEVHEDRCWFGRGAAWIAADPTRWLALVPTKLAQTFDHESFAVGYLAEADPDAWPTSRRDRFRAVLSTLHRVLVALAPLAFVRRPRAPEPGEAASRMLDRALLAAITLFAVTMLVTRVNHVWPLALAIPALAALRAVRGEIGELDPKGALRYAAWAVASVAATHAVFFGEDRYHVVLTPLFALLAAAALRERGTLEPT